MIGFETTAAKQNPFLSKYECLVLSVCDLFNQSGLFGFNYRNENAIRYELDNSDTDTNLPPVTLLAPLVDREIVNRRV